MLRQLDHQGISADQMKRMFATLASRPQPSPPTHPAHGPPQAPPPPKKKRLHLARVREFVRPAAARNATACTPPRAAAASAVATEYPPLSSPPPARPPLQKSGRAGFAGPEKPGPEIPRARGAKR